MIKALIFDCDGTLTDSMPVHYQAWRGVFEPLGIDFSEQLFYELAGMPSQKVIERTAKGRFSKSEIDDIVARRENAFFEVIDQIQPIADVVKIAEEHLGKLQMAVASGSVFASVQRQLSTIGIIDWFEVIVAAEHTEKHKPEPDVFLEAARRLGVEPHHCRVYEDSDLGLEAARRANMQGVDIRLMNAPDS